MVDVLLADSQPLTSAGLRYFLSEITDIRVVGHIVRQDQFKNLVNLHKPQLLIVDYNIPDFVSIEDLKTIKDISPLTNVLVLSADNNKTSILAVLQTGVIGYLTKECSREEIIMAVQSTAKGEKFFCHKILNIIMEKHFTPEPEVNDFSSLTTRETEILKLIASGKSTQQVADELFLSPHTVQTHRKSIIKKLNIKSPTQFVIYAMDMGLIKTR
jgi:two-component system, NarL family, invasion response regulator UvrY